MEIGISIFGKMDISTQVECFKKLGIKRTFIPADIPDFDSAICLFKENGIICETLHSPFDKINDMWSSDEAAATAMLDRLKDCVDKCEKHNIPVVIVHLSSGCPMPEINERGVKRFEELFEYADKKGVTIALENQRYLENLTYFMDKYDVGFCWDNGHEYGFTKGIRFMELFGSRACALHIHDNRCGINTDDHLLPFDGNIDFEVIAKNIADSGYKGTLMLEVGKSAVLDGVEPYADMSDEEYITRAYNAVSRLADMVEQR